MSDCRIRLATEADYDDVMSFGDVYLGTDYLQHRYHLFLADPNATPYVYILKEEIVGFCCVFLVDDGMTLLIRASRVKNGHQGRGIYGRLTRHVYDKYKEIPSIKFEAFTTNNLNFDSNKDGIRKSFTELSRKALLTYRFKVEDITIPDPPSNTSVQEVSSENMASLFEAEVLHSDLFPDKKITIDWVPLRLIPSNIKYVLAPDTTAIMSKNDNSQVSLLTIGSPVPCELGLKYIMDIFGNDVTSLRHHILWHLGHLKTLTKKVAVFQTCIVETLEKDADSIVKALGIPDIGFKISTIFSFERAYK